MRRLLMVLLGFAGSSCGRGDDLRVAPDHGAASGGQRLRLEGQDFTGHGPPGVYVGMRAAKAVVVESPWLITAITPQTDATGPVDVRIEFADGTVVGSEAAYTYEDAEGIVLRPALGDG